MAEVALRYGWRPPMATWAQQNAFAYQLRSDGLTYRQIGERMGFSRERARLRVARHQKARRQSDHA